MDAVRWSLPVLIVAAASCSGAERVKEGVATDDKIAVIALPKEQFQALLSRSVLSTQTAALHLYALGLDEGCGVVKAAIDESVQRNLPRWRTNLVAAYRDNVPADELAKAVDASPRAAQAMLKSHLPDIASAMQRSSDPLLKSAGVEALQTTAAAAARIDPSKVDRDARQKELQAMVAEGKICGVGAPGREV